MVLVPLIPRWYKTIKWKIPVIKIHKKFLTAQFLSSVMKFHAVHSIPPKIISTLHTLLTLTHLVAILIIRLLKYYSDCVQAVAPKCRRTDAKKASGHKTWKNRKSWYHVLWCRIDRKKTQYTGFRKFCGFHHLLGILEGIPCR